MGLAAELVMSFLVWVHLRYMVQLVDSDALVDREVLAHRRRHHLAADRLHHYRLTKNARLFLVFRQLHRHCRRHHVPRRRTGQVALVAHRARHRPRLPIMARMQWLGDRWRLLLQPCKELRGPHQRQRRHRCQHRFQRRSGHRHPTLLPRCASLRLLHPRRKHVALTSQLPVVPLLQVLGEIAMLLKVLLWWRPQQLLQRV